jgi:hypothetical protein
MIGSACPWLAPAKPARRGQNLRDWTAHGRNREIRGRNFALTILFGLHCAEPQIFSRND